MTKQEAKALVKRHQNAEHLTCVLGSGEVIVRLVGEDGFIFKRRTEYIETIGVYEQFYPTSDIYDFKSYSVSEVVIRRFD